MASRAERTERRRALDMAVAILDAAPALALLAAVTGSHPLAALAVLSARVNLLAVTLAAPALVRSYAAGSRPPRRGPQPARSHQQPHWGSCGPLVSHRSPIRR